MPTEKEGDEYEELLKEVMIAVAEFMNSVERKRSRMIFAMINNPEQWRRYGYKNRPLSCTDYWEDDDLLYLEENDFSMDDSSMEESERMMEEESEVNHVEVSSSEEEEMSLVESDETPVESDDSQVRVDMPIVEMEMRPTESDEVHAEVDMSITGEDMMHAGVGEVRAETNRPITEADMILVEADEVHAEMDLPINEVCVDKLHLSGTQKLRGYLEEKMTRFEAAKEACRKNQDAIVISNPPQEDPGLGERESWDTLPIENESQVNWSMMGLPDNMDSGNHNDPTYELPYERVASEELRTVPIWESHRRSNKRAHSMIDLTLGSDLSSDDGYRRKRRRRSE